MNNTNIPKRKMGKRAYRNFTRSTQMAKKKHEKMLNFISHWGKGN